MALFTDTGLIGISDLEVYEATLTQVASTHNINIASKTTIALGSIGDRLLARLLRSGAGTGPWTNPAGVGLFNILSLGPQSNWRFTLNNVVVTPQLQRWICYEILSQIFSEAYNVQLNNRFKEKWMDYTSRAQDTEQNYYDLGVGVVYDPLPQPPAAQVSASTGPIQTGIITVQTAWTDGASSESTLSPLIPVTLSDMSSIVVTNPGVAPRGAAGWNLYIGANGLAPALQNATPVPAGAPWFNPAIGIVTGKAPLNGQQPDCYVIDAQRIQRG
jgi:hypothetical protein